MQYSLVPESGFPLSVFYVGSVPTTVATEPCLPAAQVATLTCFSYCGHIGQGLARTQLRDLSEIAYSSLVGEVGVRLFIYC